MPSAGPDRGLVDRFRADLDRAGARPGDRLGVALSGGPDSLALLILAAAIGPAVAMTVDHGLRMGSAAEAETAGAVASSLGVPHQIARVSVAKGGEGLQGEARRARYAALGDWARREGLSAILTAHHADDQAETLLMRANRGAGVGGLAGIRPRNGAIVRPLLGWRRAELAEIVRAAGLTPIDDPSNRDARFDRARIRALLATAPEISVPGLATAAARLADAADALEWMAERLWAERAAVDGREVRLDPADLPAELVHRLVRRALALLGDEGRADRIAPLIARLRKGESASIGAILARPGAIWTFRDAPPRRRR